MFKKSLVLISQLVFVFTLAWTSVAATSAHAQQQHPFFQGGTPNPNVVDGPLKKLADIIIYLCMGIGVVSIAGGLLCTLPIIGKKEKGIDIIKTSSIVVVVAGVFWLLVRMLGGVFAG